MDLAILGPTLSLVALTGAVWVWMYARRLHYIFTRGIDPQSLAGRASARDILDEVDAPSDNLSNLFEVPVLYYALVAILLATGWSDPRFVQLAWGYALLRLLHSAIQLSYNRVVHRFLAHVAGCIVLGYMWARLAWIYLAAP